MIFLCAENFSVFTESVSSIHVTTLNPVLSKIRELWSGKFFEETPISPTHLIDGIMTTCMFLYSNPEKVQVESKDTN